jgi:hypothetical protein
VYIQHLLKIFFFFFSNNWGKNNVNELGTKNGDPKKPGRKDTIVFFLRKNIYGFTVRHYSADPLWRRVSKVSLFTVNNRCHIL